MPLVFFEPFPYIIIKISLSATLWLCDGDEAHITILMKKCGQPVPYVYTCIHASFNFLYLKYSASNNILSWQMAPLKYLFLLPSPHLIPLSMNTGGSARQPGGDLSPVNQLGLDKRWWNHFKYWGWKIMNVCRCMKGNY